MSISKICSGCKHLVAHADGKTHCNQMHWNDDVIGVRCKHHSLLEDLYEPAVVGDAGSGASIIRRLNEKVASLSEELAIERHVGGLIRTELAQARFFAVQNTKKDSVNKDTNDTDPGN